MNLLRFYSKRNLLDVGNKVRLKSLLLAFEQRILMQNQLLRISELTVLYSAQPQTRCRASQLLRQRIRVHSAV